MDYENERWMKVYTRDTGGWLDLSWQARGLSLELSRKLDAEGKLPLGKKGLPSLAGVLRGRWEDMKPFIEELLADERLVLLDGNVLLDPEHTERQSARASATVRKKAQRSREALSRDVTRGHAESRDVTRSHDQIRIEEKRSEETRSQTARARGPVARTMEPVVEPIVSIEPKVLGNDGDGGAAWLAWREGIKRVTGTAVSELSRWDKPELVDFVNAHAGGLRGELLMAWISSTAEAFAKAHQQDGYGLTAKRCKTWLDGGRKSARASPVPRQALGTAANAAWMNPTKNFDFGAGK